MRLVTPVSPQLLSAVHHALVGLDEMPMQPLVAMNMKIREKSCTPEFGLVARASKRGHIIEVVRKRCNKILAELEEGNYLPKNLAKAMSVGEPISEAKVEKCGYFTIRVLPLYKRNYIFAERYLKCSLVTSTTQARQAEIVAPHVGSRF